MLGTPARLFTAIRTRDDDEALPRVLAQVERRDHAERDDEQRHHDRHQHRAEDAPARCRRRCSPRAARSMMNRQKRATKRPTRPRRTRAVHLVDAEDRRDRLRAAERLPAPSSRRTVWRASASSMARTRERDRLVVGFQRLCVSRRARRGARSSSGSSGSIVRLQTSAPVRRAPPAPCSRRRVRPSGASTAPCDAAASRMRSLRAARAPAPFGDRLAVLAHLVHASVGGTVLRALEGQEVAGRRRSPRRPSRRSSVKSAPLPWISRFPTRTWISSWGVLSLPTLPDLARHLLADDDGAVRSSRSGRGAAARTCRGR